MKKKNNSGRKWIFAIAIIIIILMVGSSLMIGLDRDDQTQRKYNNFRFIYQNNQWITQVNQQTFSFYHHPSEVDYFNITNPKNLNSPLIYVTFDPNQTNEYIELSRLKLDLAAQSTANYFTHGLTQPSEEYNLPLVTCQNATPFIPVILYQKSNQTSIIYKNNCYILNAQTNSDFIKLTERIIYQFLGVIDG